MVEKLDHSFREVIAYLSPLYFGNQILHFEKIGNARNIQLCKDTLEDILNQLPYRSREAATLNDALGSLAKNVSKVTCYLPIENDFGSFEMLRFLHHFFNLMILAGDTLLPSVLAVVDRPRTKDAMYFVYPQMYSPRPCVIDHALFNHIPMLDNQISSFPINGKGIIELALNQLQKSMRDQLAGISLFDSLIEAAIGMESIFNHHDAEVTYKLSIRTAAFNGTTPEERLKIFYFVRGCYSLRSKVIHGNLMDHKVFRKCFKDYLAITGEDDLKEFSVNIQFLKLLRDTIRRLMILQLAPSDKEFDIYVVGLKTSIKLEIPIDIVK